MALAVKNPTEAAPHHPLDRLAISSLVGLAYVVGSLAVVFYAIPWLWSIVFTPDRPLINGFVTTSLMLAAMLAAAGGLGYLGGRLIHFNPPHGLRAGIFVAGAGLAAIFAITWIVGRILESLLENYASFQVVGAVATLAVGIALLFFAGRRFLRPDFEDVLIAIEDQGWFSMAPYKKAQGLRVRRGTMLGILLLAGCGVFTLLSHKTLNYGLPDQNNWYVWLPFTGGERLILLRDVRFTVPLLTILGSLWFAYRMVNFPAFADFLIATEAELNKVSWTTRKRLVQDTMVVLVTVVLMTVFLFVVDVLWGVLLTKVGVLQSGDSDTQQQSGKQEQPW